MRVSVEYRTDLVPGQRHFECTNLRALLDTGACADRWQRAMDPDMERLITCKRCPIGRQHHAEHHPELQDTARQPERAPVCVRCGRPATRMIGGEICPSCFNRAAEAKRGYNARGNPLRDYVDPHPHRVGVLSSDGSQGWRLFDGQHFAESMARAVRAGLRLSDKQPGRSVWNAERQQFEYRDERGRVLLELEIGGHIEYLAVDRLHPGDVPAPVTMPALLMPPALVVLWLEISGEGDELGVDWHQTSFACGQCGQGMVHAYRALDGIHVRCSGGCC